MFEWYRASLWCIAYLSDITEAKDLVKSEWFDRGWTLQELLAPIRVYFYNSQWERIGTKSSCAQQISEKRRIPKGALVINAQQGYSFAQIASWAAGRKTTRIEDRAYSLLGLLQISLPIIYGEGSRSFTRLQEEFMRRSTDHSILAWRSQTSTGNVSYLTSSPDDFERSGNVLSGGSSEFTFTNRGLRIDLPLLLPSDSSENTCFLECRESGDKNSPNYCALRLKRTKSERYTRVESYKLSKPGDIARSTTIYLANPRLNPYDLDHWYPESVKRQGYKIVFDISEAERQGLLWLEQRPLVGADGQVKAKWDKDKTLEISGSGSYGGVLFRYPKTQEEFAIIAGVHNWLGWIDVKADKGSESLEDVVACYYPTVTGRSSNTRRAQSPWDGLDYIEHELRNKSKVFVDIIPKVPEGKVPEGFKRNRVAELVVTVQLSVEV